MLENKQPRKKETRRSPECIATGNIPKLQVFPSNPVERHQTVSQLSGVRTNAAQSIRQVFLVFTARYSLQHLVLKVISTSIMPILQSVFGLCDLVYALFVTKGYNKKGWHSTGMNIRSNSLLINCYTIYLSIVRVHSGSVR